MRYKKALFALPLVCLGLALLNGLLGPHPMPEEALQYYEWNMRQSRSLGEEIRLWVSLAALISLVIGNIGLLLDQKWGRLTFLVSGFVAITIGYVETPFLVAGVDVILENLVSASIGLVSGLIIASALSLGGAKSGSTDV